MQATCQCGNPNNPSKVAAAELQHKLDLLLRTGSILMESAADTSRIRRTMKRAAAFLSLDERYLHFYINWNVLMVNYSDTEHSFTKFHHYFKPRCLIGNCFFQFFGIIKTQYERTDSIIGCFKSMNKVTGVHPKVFFYDFRRQRRIDLQSDKLTIFLCMKNYLCPMPGNQHQRRLYSEALRRAQPRRLRSG